MPLNARVFALVVGSAGLVLTGWQASGSDGFGPVGVLLVLAVLDAGVAMRPLAVPIGAEMRDLELDEILVAAGVFLLPPAGVLAMALAGNVAGNLSRDRSALKWFFNLGMGLGSIAAGLAVMQAIGSPYELGVTPRSVLAAVAGTFAASLISHLAVDVVLALITGAPLARFDPVRHSIADVAATASGITLGVVAGAAGVTHPWVALLTLPSLLALGVVVSRLIAAVRDHARLDALLRATQRIHATLGRADVEAAVADAAGALLESTAVVQHEPPAAGAFAVPLPRAGAWIVVQPRHALVPFTAEDERLLNAVAAIGASALDNVALLDHVRHQALHDHLTGLPNAVLLEDRARHAVDVARAGRDEVVVAALDIDRFALVNDAYGSATGDAVLRETGRRLAAALAPGDTVSRAGDDEFTLLVAGGPRSAQDAIAAAFADPFEVEGVVLRMTASAGWAAFPHNARDAVTLIRAANIARWRAKRAGGDRIVEYHGDMEVSAAEGLAMEADLHGAIDRGELWVAYQPLVDLRTGRPTGVEALVRWDHPVFGTIPPDRFLPLAERSDLIARIDLWVLTQSVRQLSEWVAAGHTDLRLAVNFSSRVLGVSGLVDHIVELAAATGVSPRQLEIEVNEKIAAAEATSATALLHELRRHGIGIAVDDFGTGYSALARLRDLPVDAIKIDQSFVRAIGTRRDDEPIVLAAIDMGHQLGLTVVAEGVETEAQQRFLEGASCDVAQGYLFSRPLPPPAATEWLAAFVSPTR